MLADCLLVHPFRSNLSYNPVIPNGGVPGVDVLVTEGGAVLGRISGSNDDYTPDGGGIDKLEFGLWLMYHDAHFMVKCKNGRAVSIVFMSDNVVDRIVSHFAIVAKVPPGATYTIQWVRDVTTKYLKANKFKKNYQLLRFISSPLSREDALKLAPLLRNPPKDIKPYLIPNTGV